MDKKEENVFTEKIVRKIAKEQNIPISFIAFALDIEMKKDQPLLDRLILAKEGYKKEARLIRGTSKSRKKENKFREEWKELSLELIDKAETLKETRTAYGHTFPDSSEGNEAIRKIASFYV